MLNREEGGVMSKLNTPPIKQLKTIASENGGLITTAEIEHCGIHRSRIPSLIKNGYLTKEAHGIYCLSDEIPDEFQILQKRSPKLVFSHGTALYLWDMSDRTPHIWDISVPQGFNASRIRKDNSKIRLHYVSADKWTIGITSTFTPSGNSVLVYDRERCIIDLIKCKDKIDKQLYLGALRTYFSNKTTDKIKLLKYAKVFQIERTVRDYMEILDK